MYKAVFTIDVAPKAYIGYTAGNDWNGWATPYFEIAEALRIMEIYNKETDNPMHYNEDTDTFYIAETEYTAEVNWKGKNYQTDEGIKHLYGIGAYSWIWDEATEEDCNFLVDEIEDFLYEYDTYEYRDQGSDREEVIDKITYELKDLAVFQQVYEIWYNENLSRDERFDALSKVLKV